MLLIMVKFRSGSVGTMWKCTLVQLGQVACEPKLTMHLKPKFTLVGSRVFLGVVYCCNFDSLNTYSIPPFEYPPASNFSSNFFLSVILAGTFFMNPLT